MISLEKTYALFSPAAGGREEALGEVPAVVSCVSTDETDEGGVLRERKRYVACVLRECAGGRAFTRGMRLSRGRESYRVTSATQGSRLWVLRLERVLTDGEA